MTARLLQPVPRPSRQWHHAPYRWLRRAGSSTLGRRLVGVRWLNNTYHALLASWVRCTRMVEVNGYRLWLDAHDYCGLLIGPYESETTAWMLRTVREGDVVVDAGAFIGYYTVLLARLAGPSGHVFAFEPEPRAFALLERNIAENGCRNVTLVPKALCDAGGRQAMHLTRSGFGGELLAERPTAPEERVIDVETVSLDEFFEGFERPISFIKMDIEGREYAALQGARRLLQRQPEVTLLLEFNPAALRRAGVEPAKLLELVEELGFGLRRVEAVSNPLDRQSLLATVLEPIGSANLVGRRAWAAAERIGMVPGASGSTLP